MIWLDVHDPHKADPVPFKYLDRFEIPAVSLLAGIVLKVIYLYFLKEDIA